jgi:hypothetical protein
MWQRVQTLFLLLLGALMIITVFMEFWQEQRGAEVASLDAFQLEFVRQDAEVDSKPVFYIAGLSVLSALIAFFSITKFKNRLLQIKLGALNSLLMAGVLGLIILFSGQGDEYIEGQQGKYLMGTYLPMAAMICNLIANRFIRRDENLVRSADRLR